MKDFDKQNSTAAARSRSQNLELNCILQDFDESYQRYAARIGVSEPTLWLLYSLSTTDKEMTQNELAKLWSTPKQTINFAISNLIKKGLVELVPIPSAKNSKAVHLTDAGYEYCNQYVQPLLHAEERAFERMTDEEASLLLALLRKNKTYFEEEIEKIL